MPDRQAGYYWIEGNDGVPEPAMFRLNSGRPEWWIIGSDYPADWEIKVLSGPLTYTPPAAVHCEEGA